jgi:hypothetical protein
MGDDNLELDHSSERMKLAVSIIPLSTAPRLLKRMGRFMTATATFVFPTTNKILNLATWCLRN